MKRLILLCLLAAAWARHSSAQTLYDDFETTPGGTRIVTYNLPAGQAGTLIQNQMNPGGNAVNMSATCARYTRNSGVQYDNFDIEAPRTMADVTPYVGSGGSTATITKHIHMDFYSPAPGTQVLLVLQNKAKNRSGGYPAGKLLGEFTATTTLTNAWETLTFNFAYVGAGNYDPTVTVTTVDEITTLIAPNSFVGTTYHFDNVYGPELSSTTSTPTGTTQLFDDFENTRQLRFTQVDGVFTPGTTNPSTTGNTSSTVGKYVRSANQYDTFEMAPLNATFFDDVAGFASPSATVHPTMKLYSTAPVGTVVQFVFANAATTTSSNYPTGRHSLYTATTTSSAGWQTLSFNYISSPDPTVKSTAVDRIQLQLNLGNAVSGTYYFDDITLPVITIPVARLYENFNNERNLTYGSRDGVLTERATNPSTTGINPNPLVGKYVRSNTQFDTFYATLPAGATMDDITDFTTGVRKLTLRVYSPEAVGTGVTVTLTDATATPTNYPTGRHSYYYATTTAQNAWQTLTLSLQATLNPGMDKVHHLTGLAIQFAGGTSSTGTWYFDQIYGPNFTVAPGTLYDDFEVNRNLTYTLTNGATLNQTYANPAVFGEDYSATVGQYARSAVANDVLLVSSSGKQLDDVTTYSSATATNYFYLKLYSKTIGTPVTLRLQNAAKAGSTNTFTGTQSVYTATTTKSNQWETLRFAYQAANPGVTTDATVSATQVTQLALSFNPGSTTTGQIFDFDFFVGQALVTATAAPPGTAVTQLYDDFETTRTLRFLQVDGAFTPGINNPSTTGNSSTTVGQYVRSANQYDTFEMAPANATFFDDVSGFASGVATVKPTMKLYSTAPVGTLVQLVLANAATTTSSNYPTGRHSIYTATTTSNTGWQTLSFTYASSPDATVKSTAVDRVQLQINAGNAVPGTYYFDDITLPATTIPVARLYENFNNTRFLTYGAADGTLTQQAANPSTTGINPNPLVGKYVRSTTTYDTFYATLPGTADDVADFLSGTRKISMRVYSPAAVNTPVVITLVDATATPTNYPTGRHSYYTANTTVQNAWQTLTFGSPATPASVAPVRNIVGIAIQFAGGTNTSNTWYFDQIYGPNFTVYDPSGTKAPGTLYDDFENSAYRQLTYSSSTGTLTQPANNPAVFGENYSAKVGHYVRSASASDVIKIVPTGGYRLTSVATYASTSATQFFYLKLFSKTVGTPVKLVLQNAAKATAAYPNPNGTQSIFTATTTKSNQWELLKFAYQSPVAGTTDATVSVNQVNQLLLLFNEGSITAGQTFDFDFIIGQSLLLATGLTWNGSVDTDWNNPDNWSGGVAPVAVSGAPATIPAGVSRYPILTAGNTYGSPDIIINAGGSLTQTGGTFNLANGVTNNGTYIQTGGVTNLAGTASHTFGNGNPMTFYDLNVGTGGAALSGGTLGTISVIHRLVLGGNVTMNADGKLILLSNASGTAMVVNRGGTVTGKVVVNRYVTPTNPGAGYRHFASPVNTATVADLHTATGSAPVVNSAYNSTYYPYTLRPLPTVYTYNEQRVIPSSTPQTAFLSGFDYGWQCPALTDALTAGKGYTVNLTPGTVTLTGTLNNGNVAVATTLGTTLNSGWQFLGNPYPSPINWDSLARPAGIDNALYVFSSTSQYGGSYESYVNGIGAGTRVVAMGQGFFTRVTSGTPTFTFTNACRLVNYTNPVQHRGNTDSRPKVVLAVQAAGGQRDVFYAYQEAGATLGFDSHYDALKIILNDGLKPTIYQQAGTESLSIQGLPVGTQPVAMQLGVNAPAAGVYSFSIQEIENIPANASVYLEDTQTHTWNDLRSGNYSVTLPQGLHATRFVLHLYQQRALATAASQATSTMQVYPNPAHVGTLVQLSNTTASGDVLSITGQVVGHFAGGKVRTTGLAAGLYLLRNPATGEQSKLVIQ